ncbi:MAG: DUF2948 family protein [Rhodobiaceae bacterium]|nr:DUF2948 family protein [Rhodobiaceae bacterium]MCC0062001.1 DUF2948 family protein [Rhodobiaceae bacterium]
MDQNSSGGLALAALDADDLEVISAHTQDAVISASDLAFQKRHAAFVAMLNRYDWDADDAQGKGREHKRRRTALHFDRVRGVRSRGFDPKHPDTVLNLLAIRYVPAGEGPAGIVELVFSGDAAIRLDVECIECRMKDMGPVWATQNRPAHSAG